MEIDNDVRGGTVGKNRVNKSTSSTASGVKRSCLSSMASLKEGLGYLKAFVVGRGKKLTARTEQEATAADMQTAKMQVEAADAAEETKARLHKTA